MPLETYLRTLDPDERPVAREWGTMAPAEFQARMGPRVEHLAELLERELRANGDRRWWDVRLADIAKVGGGGGLGSVIMALAAALLG